MHGRPARQPEAVNTRGYLGNRCRAAGDDVERGHGLNRRCRLTRGHDEDARPRGIDLYAPRPRWQRAGRAGTKVVNRRTGEREATATGQRLGKAAGRADDITETSHGADFVAIVARPEPGNEQPVLGRRRQGRDSQGAYGNQHAKTSQAAAG